MVSRLKSYPPPRTADRYYIQYKLNNIKRTKGYTKLPSNVYYASGYHDRKDKGKAYIAIQTDTGSTLVPIIKAATGKHYRRLKK